MANIMLNALISIIAVLIATILIVILTKSRSNVTIKVALIEIFSLTINLSNNVKADDDKSG